MRHLYLNKNKVDIDDETVIGITYQSYDFKNPGTRKVKITNTFSIPCTSNNLRIIENAGNPQWFGNEINSVQVGCAIYNEMLCDYYCNNEILLKNAKIRIDEISDRISIFVFEKKDIWEQLKELSWHTFQSELLDYINPPIGNTYFGDYITQFTLAGANPFLPFFYSNFYYESGSVQEDEGYITLTIDPSFSRVQSGGHFCVHVDKIFEFLEYKYGVNFLTTKNQIDISFNVSGNIFNDPICKKMIIPVRDWYIVRTEPSKWEFCPYRLNPKIEYTPHGNIVDKEDKTLHDFVTAFMQHFNIIVDEYEIGSNEIIILRRFDDIERYANIKDLTEKITGTYKFKPMFADYAQNNYIKWKEIYPNGGANVAQRTLVSKNLNSDVTKDLFSIDAYIPSVVEYNSNFILNLSTAESFKTFEFLIYNNSKQPTQCRYYDIIMGTTSDTLNLHIAQLYSLNSEYQLLERAIKYPKFYTADFWLTIEDVRNLEFFKLYYVRQLNASFFLNKISEFNPEKSKAPTTLELIKISDRAPSNPPEIDKGYVDFLAEGYTDFLSTYYY